MPAKPALNTNYIFNIYVHRHTGNFDTFIMHTCQFTTHTTSPNTRERDIKKINNQIII